MHCTIKKSGVLSLARKQSPAKKVGVFAPLYLWQVWENRNWLLLKYLAYLNSFYSPAKGSTSYLCHI